MNDNLNRLLTHEVPQPGAGPAIVTNYQYDLAGRTTLISDTAAHSLSFGFDSAKRVTAVAQLAPGLTTARTINYVLDDAGNKTRAVWADGYFVDYDFDGLGRMATVRENGTFVLATYLYDALSRRTALVYGNGTRADTSFTTQGDMLTLAHTITGSGAVYTNSFTKAHQLASESVSNAAWAYVPAVFETTSYSPANQLNQYVNVTKGANPTVTLGYDQNGNLTGDGTWSYVYDAENRLKSATSAGMTATYQYDPLGRRQAKTANGVTTTYLSDGDEEIAEYDGAGNLLRRYIPGPGTDQPIAMVTPSGSSHLHSYFHTNRQGSTVAMSNDAGTVSEGPYTYDAYGSGAPSTGVPFKYTGRRLDTETGLYYYRARYYSASLGRFLQTDPIGYCDQLNLYAYVENDPVNRADPSGLEWVCRPTGCTGTPEDGKITVYGRRQPQFDTAFQVSYHSQTGQTGPRKSNTNETSFLERLVATGLEGRRLQEDVLSDKNIPNFVKHCYGACRLAKAFGVDAARTIGVLNEVGGFFNHDIWALLPHRTTWRRFYRKVTGGPDQWAFSREDFEANEAGFDVARSGKHCLRGCMEKFKARRK